jgi:SAM-dependent methyltransferase
MPFMSFDVAAEAYDSFMGRFSRLLSPQMIELARVQPGQDALDVGCGTGALTALLVERLGADHVAGVDTSKPFVEAMRERFPDVRIELGSAEALPFDDDGFDVAIAQLVVHFMTDPVRGIGEMARVTRSGGVVAACVWDHAGTGPLSLYWNAVRGLWPRTVDESTLPGAREGHLVELFRASGLQEVEGSLVVADLDMATFDDYWAPFAHGVGPAGAHLQTLNEADRERLQSAARELAGPEPFTVSARAWAARGVA